MHIYTYEVKDGCTKDVYANNYSRLAKYQFAEETIDVCSSGEYNGMHNWSKPRMPAITHSLWSLLDEISHYIDGFGGSGACLEGIAIQMLLHADEVVLISNSPTP